MPSGKFAVFADERDPADEDVADADLVEVGEDLAEARHACGLLDAASSIPIWLSAMPSASSSSGSRAASLISR